MKLGNCFKLAHIFFLILAYCVASTNSVSAQTGDPAWACFSNVAAGETSDGQKEIQRFETLWGSVQKAIGKNDLREVSDLLSKLQEEKIKAGYPSLNDYSFYLLGQASEALAKKDREVAAFYVRKAIELSPLSPQVLFRSLRLVQLTGVGSFSRQLVKAIKELCQNRQGLFLLFRDYVYPAMWALTIALYLVFIFIFVRNCDELLKAFARMAPAGFRGVFSPPVLLLTLCFPCLGGPLWCLLVWALVCLWCLPERRILVFLVSCCISLWASIIPVRENIALRMADIGIQTVLRVSSGQYRPDDLQRLVGAIRNRPADAVAWFSLGQVLRRQGNYSRADIALQRADTVWEESQPIVKAERGLISFLKGDSATADALFSEAEKDGFDGPEFLFNYSKIKFDLLDTEASRSYYERAVRNHKDLVDTLKMSEEALGLRDRNALGEFRLPWQVLFSAVIAPMPGSYERHRLMMSLIMPGISPAMAMVLSVILLGLFLFVSTRKETKRHSTLFPDYKIPSLLRGLIIAIPGGGWALAGQPVKALLSLVFCIFLILPFTGWPASSSVILEYLPDLNIAYICLVILVCLGFVYAGYFAAEEE